MKLKTLILVSLAVSAGLASAQGRQVSEPISPAAFDQVDPATLSADSIVYSENILPFPEWQATAPAEAQIMNLYDGFVEPTVNFTNANNQPDSLVDYLTMYNARTKTVVNKSAAQINLKLMVDLATINSIETAKAVDPNAAPEQGVMVSKQITAADLIHNKLAAGQPIDNFGWCNQTNGGDILKPSKETDLSYVGGKPWCAASDRSICIESCYLFGTGWRIALKSEAAARAGKNSAANALDSLESGVRNTFGLTPIETAVRVNRREDLGVAMQSEIKYFLSEAEYGAKVPLSQLTHINTPVRGVIEQSTFYINQVFKFSKVVTVIQEHPTDAAKSIMTSMVTMGVRTHSWNKPMLGDHLKGEGLWNEDSGLSAGVPWFTQNMTKRIAEILESSATN